ncbi:hypothetical protein NQ317_012720 [Molorchus minor]|uniref:Tubulin-specific chaperone cofactor E-like protein n=1 Tax=Molorchus minor TaxID=1323400 RepID=A0ABQ9IZE3_9CUCU|nr:hypothetical protein NQ317_012720 [Molorchus minor]
MPLIAKCAGVEELDLAKNKLNDWPEVFGILQQMPRLKFVNLSFNVLSTPLREVEVDRNMRWQQLKNLVLNSTYICWESVQDILDHLPGLEELHLSHNEYNNVYLYDKKTDSTPTDSENDNHSETCSCPSEEIGHKHSGIRILHFTGNRIDNWEESLEIDQEREEGGACNRNYERTESQPESSNGRSSPHDCFRQLKVINLNSTQLAKWNDIERLSKFPVLECVRVQGCPLWESNEYTEHERRQLLIASLPNVTTLNGGGIITPEEREASERAFIRYYMDKPESDRPERYSELIQIHGKLDPLVNVDLRPEKRGPELMKYPSKRLYSYNIRSGDEIIIDCKKKPGDITNK